jgi:hypothetical protein
MSPESSRRARAVHALGDYTAGAVTAIVAAVPIHAIVEPGWDVVAAMLLGTAIGTLVHFAILALVGPLVGLFQVMAPGGLIGMYGGMFFAMRDSMQAASWPRVILVAALFGVTVVAGVSLYDRALRSNAKTR